MDVDYVIAQINRDTPAATDWLTGGCGNLWPARCPDCGAAMQIVRPGDCRCEAECWLSKEE